MRGPAAVATESGEDHLTQQQARDTTDTQARTKKRYARVRRGPDTTDTEGGQEAGYMTRRVPTGDTAKSCEDQTH